MDIDGSLIDHWSLEQAGYLLNGDGEYKEHPDATFSNCLGGLSNYINALLLYDNTHSLDNGFAKEWEQFSRFKQKTEFFLVRKPVDNLEINWNSEESYADQGVSNYLVAAAHHQLDLFVSPERATQLKQDLKRGNDKLKTTLDQIDKNIQGSAGRFWYEDVRLGIHENLRFPSLTHYALSQSSNENDLLTVIMQLKDDGKIKRIRSEIEEMTKTTQRAAKFQQKVEHLISKTFSEPISTENSWSIQITALIFSLSRNFNLDFFNRSKAMLFLKDIVNCRSETRSLSNSIERIFKRKIELL